MNVRARLFAVLAVVLAVSGSVVLSACEDKKAAADAHLKKGVELIAQGKFEAAADELKKAAELNKDSIEARVRLAAAYRGLKKYDDALAAYRDAKKIDRYKVGPHIAQADMQIELGRIDAATTELNHVVELDPTNVQALVMLGRVSLIPLKDQAAPTKLSIERAVLNLEAAAGRAPDNVEAFYHLGRAAEMMGDKAKAVAAWTKVAELTKGKAGAEKMADDVGKALARLK